MADDWTIEDAMRAVGIRGVGVPWLTEAQVRRVVREELLGLLKCDPETAVAAMELLLDQTDPGWRERA